MVLAAVVECPGGVAIRKGFGGNEIFHPHLDRIELQLARDDIDEPFENVRRVGFADAAQ